MKKWHSDSSAVGSALRSGRRGRAFESPLSDMWVSFRRPIIRIALLLVAWCCGFLFFMFVGEGAGKEFAGSGVGGWMFEFWERCTDMLQQRLQAMGLSEETYGQVVALTLGKREYLSPVTKALYREAGASHMLALSGMHLSILYGMMRWFVGRMSLTRWKWGGFCIALVSIWSYAIMTGCPKSLIRAALMLSVSLMTLASKEKRGGVDVLVVSAAIVLLLDPASLMDIGFQMSCAAMLGIMLLGLPLADGFKERPWLVRVVTESLCISLSAQLCTMPLTLWYFGSIATYSALTSLVAIPLTMMIIYASIGVYAGCVWMVVPLEALISLQNRFMSIMANLPGAYIVL